MAECTVEAEAILVLRKPAQKKCHLKVTRDPPAMCMKETVATASCNCLSKNDAIFLSKVSNPSKRKKKCNSHSSCQVGEAAGISIDCHASASGVRRRRPLTRKTGVRAGEGQE